MGGLGNGTTESLVGPLGRKVWEFNDSTTTVAVITASRADGHIFINPCPKISTEDVLES